MDETKRLELMARIAHMFYKEEISQVDIAGKLDLSKAMVSRLLSEARRRNLVEITIHYPWRNNHRLEEALVNTFHLKHARVLEVENIEPSDILRGVGIMGARLLEKFIRDDITLAISRGTGVYSVVQELQPRLYLNVNIVQLQGALGDRMGDGSDLAHFLSKRYSGDFHFIHAPMILENRNATETMMQQISIRETLELSKKADLALVGIGSIDPEVSSIYRNGVLTKEELLELADQGIVGDVAGRHFDANGDVLDIDFNHRLVCVSKEVLQKIPLVLGVATGIPKVKAIRAALKGRFINMLATDSTTAQRLLLEE